jgi:glycosyltransferase involved in cell wall biosynthesis
MFGRSMITIVSGNSHWRCVIRTGVITYDFFPLIGGIGRLTYTLYCELMGKDILFFSPADNSLPGHIRIISPFVRLFKQVGVAIWLHFNVQRIISEHKLDKLNIHSGAGGVLFFRKIEIPVIITCHHTYWQHYHYITSQFWKRIFYPFEKLTYRRAYKIISDCEDTTRVLVERYGIPEEKITVIPCAVDNTKFHRTNQARKPDSIFYIGRIDTRKGVDFLIRSMPFVVQQVPDALLLVGGSGGHLDKMKALVSRLNLERNVTFLGFVPDDQLNALYNQTQCVVVPSIFEGFGITVIEAIATGTRVVGTDVDGIRSTINSGDYGSLVPYGDCKALAEALVTELKNPRKAQELRPEYLLDQFRDRYLEVLEATQ